MPSTAYPFKTRKRGSKDTLLVSAVTLLDIASSQEVARPMPFSEWDVQLEIIQPELGNLTHRTPKECARHLTIHNLASRKLNRVVECTSKIEWDFAHILEVHPLVSSYKERPFKITWKDRHGIDHYHIPTFLADMKNGHSVVFEVESDRALEDEAVINRTRLMSLLLPIFHYKTYSLVVASQIPESVMQNAKKIRKFKPIDLSLEEFEVIRQILRSQEESISMRDLVVMSRFAGVDHSHEKVESMIASGHLGFNLHSPWNEQVSVHWIGE